MLDKVSQPLVNTSVNSLNWKLLKIMEYATMVSASAGLTLSIATFRAVAESAVVALAGKLNRPDFCKYRSNAASVGAKTV